MHEHCRVTSLRTVHIDTITAIKKKKNQKIHHLLLLHHLFRISLKNKKKKKNNLINIIDDLLPQELKLYRPHPAYMFYKAPTDCTRN